MTDDHGVVPVRLVTNPGSNLAPTMVERYRVHLTPQQIVVGGADHDTREPIELATVDRWVEGAKEHPHVVGSTAAEHVQLFRTLLAEEGPILVLTTSKKVIQTYEAARSARRSIHQLVSRDAVIRIVDCGATDFGVGLAVVLAGEALAAGRSVDEVVNLLERYAEHARMLWTLETLDYSVKSGRVTGIRAFLANILRVRPMVGFVDGEAKMVGRVKVRDDSGEALLDELEKSVPAGSRIALAVVHGDVLSAANDLVRAAQSRFDAAFTILRPLSPAVYLYSGKGTLAAIAVALDALPFAPPSPPAFD